MTWFQTSFFSLLLHRFTLCSTLWACQCTRHFKPRQALRAHGHGQMVSVRHTSPWQQPSCWRAASFVSGPTVGSWLLKETLNAVKNIPTTKLQSPKYELDPSASCILIGHNPILWIAKRVGKCDELWKQPGPRHFFVNRHYEDAQWAVTAIKAQWLVFCVCGGRKTNKKRQS